MKNNQKNFENEEPHEGVLFSAKEKMLYFLIIWLVPTITIVDTTTVTLSGTHHITETSFMWPWLILLQYNPSAYFHTGMYNFILPPYSLIVFFPSIMFLFSIGSTNKGKLGTNLRKFYLLAFLQIFLIWFINQSQEFGNPNVSEERFYLFIPQFIMLGLILLKHIKNR